MTQRRQYSIVGGLIVLGLIGYTWAVWIFFTEPIPGGNDLLAHYTAWEAYIIEGYSPYSDEAALYTQNAIYGRSAQYEEDQNRLTYPFYSGLVHAPFIFIDYALARAIYMTLLQVALFTGVIMTLQLVRWRPVYWLLTILLVWTMIYYPHARGVILGQFAIFGFFSIAASIFFLKRGKDKLAGAILVLSTVKPTLIFLAVPFLMLWAVARRRRAFLWSFLVLMGLMILASFIILPTWMGEWIERIFLYSEYTVGQSPVWLFTHSAIPSLGMVGELIIIGLLIVIMLWSWWKTFKAKGETWFFWSLGVTLVVSNLIVPRSATTNYVTMLIPMLWVFAALDRTSGWGRTALVFTLIISAVALWWLHYSTVIGNQEQPIMFIPAPVILGLILAIGYQWLMRDAKQNNLAL